MEFITPVQARCFERIKLWMLELFGDRLRTHDTRPMFEVWRGSAKVEVAVYPWREEESVIVARALVAKGVRLQSELLEYLLRQNSVLRFGAFCIEGNDEIYFAHSIVGSTCDKPELEASVTAVASAADHHDDIIIERWGGRRAIDLE